MHSRHHGNVCILSPYGTYRLVAMHNGSAQRSATDVAVRWGKVNHAGSEHAVVAALQDAQPVALVPVVEAHVEQQVVEVGSVLLNES